MLSTIMILPLLFYLVNSEAAGDGRTLLSITNTTRPKEMIDVHSLPSLLKEKIGYVTDPKISAFIKSVRIKALTHLNIQIVWTSVGHLDSVTFCNYTAMASKLLPDILAICDGNAPAERNGGSTKNVRTKKCTGFCDDLKVNDPGACSETHLKRMHMREVWDLIHQYPLRDTSVAIIDDGVDFEDSDLKPVRGTFRKSNGGVLQGFWDTFYDTASPHITEYHGTQIARIMAAKANNSFGMVGIAPNVKLMGIKVSDNNDDFFLSEVLDALDLAIDIEVDVISISLSFFCGPSKRSRDCIMLEYSMSELERRNIIIISAAGNRGQNDPTTVPCAYNASNSICVGALRNNTDDNSLARYSNYGPQVQIAAFGDKVQVDYKCDDGVGMPVTDSGLKVEPAQIKRLLMRYASPLARTSRQIDPHGGALEILNTIKGALNEAGFSLLQFPLSMLSTMMILPLLFYLVNSEAAGDGRTLLSITNTTQPKEMIDVHSLPSLLKEKIGYVTDPKISSFIKSVRIKTLTHLNIQIVWTSVDHVDSVTFCNYTAMASRLLPDILVICADNPVAKLDGGHNPKRCECDLHVNDPGACTQCQLKRMHMPEVWDLVHQHTLRDVSVAIIDDGIDFSDPDLAPARGVFRRSDGVILHGSWDTVYNTSNPHITRRHGTKIAQIMAAKVNNSHGMAGIAPNLKLIGIKVTDDDEEMYLSEISEGLDLAMDIGVEVVSLSLSLRIEPGPFAGMTRYLFLRALDKVVNSSIIVVSAAGNYGADEPELLPCALNSTLSICVGAITNAEHYTLSTSSNYGPQVHIAAFGEDVQVLGDTANRPPKVSGTSFAVPFVVGTIGMLLGLNVEPKQIKSLLMHNASPLDAKSRQINPNGGVLEALNTIKAAVR
ncbi:Suppressor of the cold-sensitive snRNP bioproteinsis mutant brr1-1 [Perkinsus chesapeaki]|uniref:subtilisin n=1 Tax=Perkinsus chesapeaki TaxID=330153 RepID=A0A7J6LW47_PERCH|nr:Suppressor of the cold-sensitive snRNP bioproteinsis mutant brr1-1 [Perkinsus chesapeaki]